MIITLCGSVKFKDRFDYWNAELSKQGISVFSVGVVEKGLPPSVKCQLDIVHYEKIRASDAILVMDEADYIGESTIRQIYYAMSHNKRVYLVSSYPESERFDDWCAMYHLRTLQIENDRDRLEKLITIYNERSTI